MKINSTINVIGLGYIGLPTSLIFSKVGFKVHGSDINKDTVINLNKKILPIEENGLQELFESSLKNDISFSEEVKNSDFYIICVPTPYLSKIKKIDPSYVVKAVENALKFCKSDSIIIIESTISPGTIHKFITPLVNDYNQKHEKSIKIAHAPERIIPGNMVYELENNSRTIGADDEVTLNRVAEIYSSITKGQIVKTSIFNAELTKVVENTFRAVNIAFSNELLKLGSYYNFDPYEVIKICNLHPRVKILNPGPGVGGHCIPIDPWFLVGDWPLHTELIKLSLETNESMPQFVIEHINKIKTKHSITNQRIGLYGLTYKEDVDDVRESPSLQLLSLINKNLGENIISFDPTLNKLLIPGQTLSYEEFLEKTDFIVIMVKHSHLKNKFITLNNKIILDTHNFTPKDGFANRYLLSDQL
jgi:UDP-N-acetyl-D-mannosaminuronic acid dehydrogenase